ncbi:uncharacterized protein M6B38_292890 [Iris pallida]|uniref:Uncharacterized protein n=1 Tax=Iris pallida TaxID=29817 RepID=A0AAX6HUQ7_IRIPA|nr:uncharacterized protein M6B38_292890 [Iris pallida]
MIPARLPARGARSPAVDSPVPLRRQLRSSARVPSLLSGADPFSPPSVAVSTDAIGQNRTCRIIASHQTTHQARHLAFTVCVFSWFLAGALAKAMVCALFRRDDYSWIRHLLSLAKFFFVYFFSI